LDRNTNRKESYKKGLRRIQNISMVLSEVSNDRLAMA
jgi:hypothetical protein